ncbi:MAG: TolC family protein [Bacteroidetes bacterium]|nr:TolC family protein [Bacteroidota bacterium]MBU1116205.1 TolC family protein [Bacteroidota bacterium]MBU1799879.1 TolC family protein [Bacteroidota bacterium]
MKNINLFILVMILLSINYVSAQKVITLEESKQFALQNNTESKNSKLEVDASRQIKNSAFTYYFPNISAGGFMFEAQKSLMEMETPGGNLPVYDGNPANLATATQFAYFPGGTMELLKKGTIGYINVMQPIFAGGRIINGNKLASLGEEASELKGKMTQNEILQKTEEQYWQIVSLEEKHITIEKYEALLNRLLIQVEDAFKSGLVMKNDLLKVKLKLSEVLLNKSKLENGTKLATMAFCQHIGIPYDSTLVLRDELAIGELPQSLLIDNTDALKNRNEYSLLELSVRAEELKTNMKLGEYLPQAGIGVNGMYMKFDEGKGRTLGMVFGTVSIPISNWWGGSHELEERSIKEEIAENNFKNNSELLVLQMEKAWQDLTDSYKQYLLSEESKVQAEENYKVNNDSYKNGLITTSDLLEAQALLQQTEDQLIDAKANYIVKKTTYLQVTGR